MEWTESHDVALCKEVLVQNPFLARKKTVQRAAIWQKIADELVSLSRPKFKVTLTKRSVQDRLLLIITKHKKRMATERRESGTSPETSELDKLLEDIVEKEKCYEQRRESEGDANKRKQELDKVKGEEARNKVMEKLSETKRRKNNVSEVEPKRRRSGSEKGIYLREKSEREASIKEREFELEQRKQDEERKRHEGFMQQQQQQQQLQMMLSQQNQIMIALLEKFVSKS